MVKQQRPPAASHSRKSILAILGLALLVRVAGIHWGLPDVFEEAYPFKLAWRMWGFEGGAPTLNPHFFHYPSLMIYVQFVVIGAVRALLAITGAAPDVASLQAYYAKDPTLFYLAGRLVIAVMGACTVLPAMRMAKEAAGPRAALLAGLLVALSPALVTNSQLISVDVPLTLLTTWAVALAVDLAGRSEPRAYGRAALCGLAVGLATSTKYPGALTLIPMGIALAYRAPRASVRQVAIESCVLLGAAVVAFLATSPFVLLDASAALADLTAERAHLQLGHFGSERGAAWAYYARSWFVDAFGCLVGIAAIAGVLLFSLGRRKRWAVVAAGFLLPYMFLMSAWAMKADRYLLPLIPLGVVFAAAFAVWAFASALRRPATAGFVLGVTLLCIVSDLPRWNAHASRFGPDSRSLARTWVSRSIPSGAMVIVEPYGPRLASPLELVGVAEEAWRPSATHRARTGPYYWVVPIPMFQVAPERSAVYYDPRLYPHADAWIISGAVRSRYQQEPDRFPVQNAFYEWLDTHWTLATRIHSTTGTGTEIVIYRNPAHNVPFAQRIVPPPPPTPLMLEMGGVDAESAFYYALGVNYFGYGRPREALQCLRQALAFPQIGGGVTREQIERAIDLTAERLRESDSHDSTATDSS